MLGGRIGMMEMVFLFAMVLLLFGAKRLPEIGASLGKGIREFKGSIREIEGELKQVDRLPEGSSNVKAREAQAPEKVEEPRRLTTSE